MSPPYTGNRLATAIVRRTAIEAASRPDGAHHLTEAIVGYINDIQRAGVYAAHELPAKAMQAFHADYYLAQVNNGGHSQFIHNSGETLWPTISADALAGLQAMGAQAQHRILAEAVAWVDANPQDAASQNGFSVRAPLLDKLDEQFYEAESAAPMTERAARWICGWSELRTVADDQYAGAIEQVAAMNPALGLRLIWRSTEALRHQLSDSLQISIAAACGAVAPEPETKIAVRAGAYFEIEGQQRLAFGVETDRGARLCVADEAGARLYEYVRRSPPLPSLGPDFKIEKLEAWQPPVVGACLSTVSIDQISRFASMAEATQAAEALDLMVREMKLERAPVITAWKLTDDGATWIVVSGQRRLAATISRRGGDLVELDGRPVLSVGRAEIEHHAAEADRGLTTMSPPK